MVNLGCKRDLGRLEGIIAGEMDGEKEDSAGERAVGRAHDGRLPVEHVVADGTRGALRRWIPAQILQLLRYALQSHFEERLNECQRAMRAPSRPHEGGRAVDVETSHFLSLPLR